MKASEIRAAAAAWNTGDDARIQSPACAAGFEAGARWALKRAREYSQDIRRHARIATLTYHRGYMSACEDFEQFCEIEDEIK